MKTNPNDPITATSPVVIPNSGEIVYGDIGLTKREDIVVKIYVGMITATFGQEALVSVHPSMFALTAIEAVDALIAELNK